MLKRIFWITLATGLGLVLVILSTFYLFVYDTKEYNQSDKKVFVKKDGNKFTLIRNGNPFFVKGGSGYEHIGELAKIGGNTIRTWDTTNLQLILDEAHKHDIAVIAGFNMLTSEYSDLYYGDKDKVNEQYNSFKGIVEKYKDHPALLMWCLGNELEFRPNPDHFEFLLAYRKLVKMIRSTDPDHPITTTIYDRGRKDLATLILFDIDLDILSTNRFGNLVYLKDQLKADKWLWNRPFLITEWGIKGPWEENRTKWGAPIEEFDSVKARNLDYAYQNYFPHDHPAFLGSLVFYWGQKQERTHTWFSLFDKEGNTSQLTAKVQEIFTDSISHNSPPLISKLELDQKVAEDNIIIGKNQTVKAEVQAFDPDNDSLMYEWEIKKEQWYYTTRVHNDIATGLEGLVQHSNAPQTQLKTPKESGPYRLFVYIKDNRGHFGAANIPFYVMK